MPKRMLIDASHPEETRVVVIDGQRVDEFDFEAASKRPLKGNIYLAKVTRVEPSLQAAFVEYGGNRQGFLAFSEIHPDYYQIPVADRQALLAEQQEEARRYADEEFEAVATGTVVASDEELESEETADVAASADGSAGFAEPVAESSDDEDAHYADDREIADTDIDLPERSAEATDGADRDAIVENGDEHAETTSQYSEENPGPSDSSLPAGSEAKTDSEDGQRSAQPLRSQRPPQRWVRKRHYKIQEVIKRKQIMLVQVVKEERGTKGAALTTYLSLAGRYCVLMPNTPRGGGISRKITNAVDRNRLKAAAATLELPEGMGLIIRTAGANRTKLEIKRDYEYLLRLWDQIRELTLESNAPACVYEEGDIIKRAIRDLYNKDVTEIVVEGDEGYRNAKEFMRMLMPSHAKNVKQYRDQTPLFQKHHIEAQLDAMFQPTVTLKSGGYIVINQTEALVSIDVNSGRATREHSIEETAHKTNLEAADEVGRQLRLRDLAGLIVIDFIDMEDARNDRDVERRVRDAVKNDRARVQIGKISQFGLLEMSRQRLRAGVVAGSTVPCPHCGGQGIVRSVESTALRLLRALDEEGQQGRTAAVNVRVSSEVALYTLNQKRRELARIENEHGMIVTFQPEEELVAGSFDLERLAPRTSPPAHLQPKAAISADAAYAAPTDMAEPVEEGSDADQDVSEAGPNGVETGQTPPQAPGGKKRRRRRRGRGGSSMEDAAPKAPVALHENGNGQTPPAPAVEAAPTTAPADGTENADEGTQPSPAAGQPRRRRRRRRKPRSDSPSATPVAGAETPPLPHHADHDTGHVSSPFGDVTPNMPSEPVWSLDSSRPDTATATAKESVGEMYYRREEALDVQETQQRNTEQRQSAEPQQAPPAGAPDSDEVSAAQPQRRGWWQRTFKNGG